MYRFAQLVSPSELLAKQRDRFAVAPRHLTPHLDALANDPLGSILFPHAESLSTALAYLPNPQCRTNQTASIGARYHHEIVKKGGLRVPKEINLLARFTILERAQACRDALRHQGFDVVQIDNIPSMESSQLLSHAPMVEWGRYGYEYGRLDDKWTMPAAWDHQGLGYGEDWLLTAVVPHDGAVKASAIIKEFGGKL